MPSAPPPTLAASAGVGLDAGGTQTRWALATADGALLGEGAVAGLSALQLADEAGRAALRRTLAEVAAAVGGVALGGQRPTRVVAGVTGFGAGDAQALGALLADALALPAAAVRSMTDIELLCLAAFAPGRGVVVYAGTGSVAAHLDAAGELQRAGGRGVIVDDAGGGHWIACQALRAVWRAEDERPGAWRDSALAQALFERIGGADWSATRAAVYGATRGEIGTLALAVASAADRDPVALALLQQAGRELARLAGVLQHRVGTQPVALAGRVFDLHPAVEAGLREALPPATEIERLVQPAHHAAARLAARS